MSINKKYVMAGMLATAAIIPMADVTNSYADEMRITTTRVNFRKGPGTNYSSMQVIEKGQTVEFLGESGDWANVKYNSKTGYIHKDYLATQSSTPSNSVMYVNASSGLNVRKGPSTSYAKVAKLANGTQVNVITTSGDWSKITSGSITGYVSNAYLTASPSNNGGSNESNDNNQATTTKYVNSNSNLNVRSGPSTSHSVVTKLTRGTAVTVHSTSNGWSKITVNGVSGYVSSQYLSDTKPSTPSEGNNSGSQTATTKYVTANSLNVRSGAGTNYSKVGSLSKGTQVTVHSTSNGWSKITSGSVNGYVSDQYLSTTKPSTSNDSTSSGSSTTDRATKVVNFAKQQLGKKYVWGAQGPSSFDCSGFTYYVYKNSVGVTLNRTSSAQSSNGSHVSKSNLRAGDLVFFDTSGPNNGAISHVGIYIGGGQMIHASSGKGQVVITSMNTSYWNKAYVTARRVV